MSDLRRSGLSVQLNLAEEDRRYELSISGEGRSHRYVDQPKIGEDGTHQDVVTLLSRIRRGEWVEDIHGWRINPVQVVAVRVTRR